MKLPDSDSVSIGGISREFQARPTHGRRAGHPHTERPVRTLDGRAMATPLAFVALMPMAFQVGGLAEAHGAMAAAMAAVSGAVALPAMVDVSTANDVAGAAASFSQQLANADMSTVLEAACGSSSVYFTGSVCLPSGVVEMQQATTHAAAVTAANIGGAVQRLVFDVSMFNPFGGYELALRQAPFATKVLTAGSLACIGDAIAQRLSGGLSALVAPQEEGFVYDVKRGAAFLIFGAAYTGAFQAVWFDWLNAHLVGIGIWLHIWATSLVPPPSPEVLAAAKVAINQFAVVPLLYMPLFFAITGALGGLDVNASIERMRTLYAPILKRNYVRCHYVGASNHSSPLVDARAAPRHRRRAFSRPLRSRHSNRSPVAGLLAARPVFCLLRAAARVPGATDERCLACLDRRAQHPRLKQGRHRGAREAQHHAAAVAWPHFTG